MLPHLLFPTLLLAFSCNGRPAAAQEETSLAAPTHAGADTDTAILSLSRYTAADSAAVERLLREDCGTNDVLYYARRFKGVPYVAYTLEKEDPERLIVNLRELDCTTLVETTLALTMTRREGKTAFADYCRNLMNLRYFGGRMDGYLSRLHYFSYWIHDHLDRGLITEVTDPRYFTAPMTVNNRYMSTHPDRYRFLKDRPERVDSIKRLEARYNGPDGTYLPAASTALSRKELSVIRDGDLIAIVTNKDGLDYSHLGFAVWGRDGRLHLLNASSIHHRVVEEPKTLRQYLREHPSSIGIRLFRLVR